MYNSLFVVAMGFGLVILFIATAYLIYLKFFDKRFKNKSQDMTSDNPE